jgi:hypothetical protein
VVPQRLITAGVVDQIKSVEVIRKYLMFYLLGLAAGGFGMSIWWEN